MAGKFTIKRRKASPRPDGQSSQSGILAALGIGVGRSSKHTGSKPGYVHLTQTWPQQSFAAAQEWHVMTGRPLPPQMRVRSPIAPPAALALADRHAGYCPSSSAASAAQRLDDPRLTPAQRRRLRHKAGHHGERPAGYRKEARP
jgi:hypothetical protein